MADNKQDEGVTAPKYVVPTLRLSNQMHLFTFKQSLAYQHITGFIKSLNEAVKGHKCSSPDIIKSDATNKTLTMLDRLDEMVKDTPPVNIQGRFGNPAFKTWHAKFTLEVESLIESILPEEQKSAVIELKPYLMDAFGNPVRVDYGTGHELAFIAFLCCLTLLGVFTAEDAKALVLVVFNRYLQIVRLVQTTYKLEPAGSRGSWGLDDHQFLCYLWGSAQFLNSNDNVEPCNITDEAAAERLGDENLFFGAVRHIRKVKTGPFFEHSRYLFDISAVPEWTKVNKGLTKMYDDEVLFKLPIMQHFFFGSLLTIDLPTVVRKIDARDSIRINPMARKPVT